VLTGGRQSDKTEEGIIDRGKNEAVSPYSTTSE